MKVDKVGIDLLTHDAVVILKDLEGKRYFPIRIGPFEATAIALALEGTQVPRPLSHELMRTMLESLHATLEQIVIHDFKDSTFFAKLVVRQNGNTHEIDARPSDGIALALRIQAPIYVSDKIELEKFVADEKAEAEDTARFKKFWKNSNPATSKGSPRALGKFACQGKKNRRCQFATKAEARKRGRTGPRSLAWPELAQRPRLAFGGEP
jgi:bifunctional DNase/RNase